MKERRARPKPGSSFRSHFSVRLKSEVGAVILASDADMSGFGPNRFLHTCYRIGDIERSVSFYEKLGFEERGRMPIGDEAVNVFMGLPGEDPRLELTHNFGVASYELGTGYNHIALGVDDLDATLERLATEGIEPEKPPYRPGGRTEGSRICFVRDPDGYRCELVEAKPSAD